MYKHIFVLIGGHSFSAVSKLTPNEVHAKIKCDHIFIKDLESGIHLSITARDIVAVRHIPGDNPLAFLDNKDYNDHEEESHN